MMLGAYKIFWLWGVECRDPSLGLNYESCLPIFRCRVFFRLSFAASRASAGTSNAAVTDDDGNEAPLEILGLGIALNHGFKPWL